MKSADKNIPPQTEGRQTDFASSKTYADQPAAHQAFLSAKAKLLDISNWHNYAGPGSAKFGLTDDKGILLHRLAQVNDYFFADLPATPGSDAGDGLEWILIEKIMEAGNADGLEESITVIVRPTAPPNSNDEPVAHFFSKVSTNTFMIVRYQNKISAEAHGRNEQPNNEGVDLFDKIRNTLLGLSARIGLSGMQWQKLVEGFLED